MHYNYYTNTDVWFALGIAGYTEWENIITRRDLDILLGMMHVSVSMPAYPKISYSYKKLIIKYVVFRT